MKMMTKVAFLQPFSAANDKFICDLTEPGFLNLMASTVSILFCADHVQKPGNFGGQSSYTITVSFAAKGTKAPTSSSISLIVFRFAEAAKPPNGFWSRDRRSSWATAVAGTCLGCLRPGLVSIRLFLNESARKLCTWSWRIWFRRKYDNLGGPKI